MSILPGLVWEATTPIFNNDDIAQIVGEANIIGIVTPTAVFGTMSDIQFLGAS